MDHILFETTICYRKSLIYHAISMFLVNLCFFKKKFGQVILIRQRDNHMLKKAIYTLYSVNWTAMAIVNLKTKTQINVFYLEIMKAKDSSIFQATIIKLPISQEDYRFYKNQYMLWSRNVMLI